MNILETKAYQNAFIRYLRKGTPISLSLKAIQERVTTHYVWRTSGDGKVRPSHAANEGRIFAWDDPPETGHPGEDYNCRCIAEPYYGVIINDPPIEPVYPELLILPLLRVPRLASAWRAWALRRELVRQWRLGDHKTAIQWRNRMERGNWTPQEIEHTIKEGSPYKAPNKVNKLNTATGYELNGKFVVVDDATKEVLQVSGTDFIPEKLP